MKIKIRTLLILGLLLLFNNCSWGQKSNKPIENYVHTFMIALKSNSDLEPFICNNYQDKFIDQLYVLDYRINSIVDDVIIIDIDYGKGYCNRIYLDLVKQKGNYIIIGDNCSTTIKPWFLLEKLCKN